MNRVRNLALATLIVSWVLVVGFGLSLFHQRLTEGRATTTTRLSPDETLRASVIEVSPTWGIDRNFRVRLDDLSSGRRTIILHSPDEGRPPGTERLVWSKDGAWLLLVGRHFLVKEDLFLDNGDQLYFLHHVPTARGWCNSSASRLPPLRAEQVRGIEFTEPVVLK